MDAGGIAWIRASAAAGHYIADQEAVLPISRVHSQHANGIDRGSYRTGDVKGRKTLQDGRDPTPSASPPDGLPVTVT